MLQGRGCRVLAEGESRHWSSPDRVGGGAHEGQKGVGKGCQKEADGAQDSLKRVYGR